MRQLARAEGVRLSVRGELPCRSNRVSGTGRTTPPRLRAATIPLAGSDCTQCSPVCRSAEGFRMPEAWLTTCGKFFRTPAGLRRPDSNAAEFASSIIRGRAPRCGQRGKGASGMDQPTPESVEKMWRYARKFAEKSGTVFHPDPEVT